MLDVISLSHMTGVAS